ncbi:MAG: L7Ae/L30e/S12e/Gadd45 family ribosomal protein [Gemmatimonadaceae bacterium]
MEVEGTDSRKLTALIGLGLRARGAIVGVQQVREAAKRGKLQLAIAAPDASNNSLDKVLPLLRARGVEVLVGPAATELGSMVGRDATAVIGIVDRGLAKGIRALNLSALPGGREAGEGLG